jgi:chromosome segregation protein
VAEQLADEAERAEDDAAERADRLDGLTRHHTDRAEAIAAAEAQALAVEAHRDAAVEALHRARTQAVSRRERLDAMQHAQSRIARQIEELRARVARAEESTRRVEARREALATERVSCAAQMADLGAASGDTAAALQTARAAETAAGELLRAARAGAARDRQAGHQARERLTEARLALQAARLRVEHLEQAVAGRGLGEAESLLAETAHEPPLDAETRSRHGQLVGLLSQMGDVNPAAIEELAEVTERFEFLSEQRADLDAALADLHAAIARIDDTSRQLFADTFAAVNAQFRSMFPRLFRGGEAELVLTEPEDLLGTGIEMLVCPPGKKVQNVSLLSGGEKALCAIALIFAVFRVKPSPFCLLDEVDAPLDDANIGRFNELVREMSQMSQIVLITHNKRTMEIADILYGITMEEAGISKLVGVRMT